MEQKNINYLNKDFNSLKQSLIDFAKTYYPNTYNDFSASSPGMMFIEMAAYVGDVLSFYQDTQFQETLLQYAKEKENLYTLAYMLGYRPKVTTAAIVDLDVYQLLPAVLSGSSMIPDFRYAMSINEGTQVKSTSNSNVSFYIPNKVDFQYSSSLDPTMLSVHQLSGTNPEYYLLKKTTKGLSGTQKSTSFSFGAPEKFQTSIIEDDNIIEIISVIDSDGNKWYEVPYMAQETIFEDIQNIPSNDPNFNNQQSVVPYLLRLKQVPRRFTTRFTSTNKLELQFGAGISDVGYDEEIIPNSNNVGLGIVNGISKLNVSYDPSNFLFTQTYGISPSNTTLTVNYLVGGGVEANLPSNDLTDLSLLNSSFSQGGLNPELSSMIQNSVAINNPTAAVGGKDGDSEDDIRFNTLAAFPSQLRAVTKEDYIIRTLSMPSKYGSVSKVYITQDQIADGTSVTDSLIDNNPLALSMYVLGINSEGTLTTASSALKQNIKTYISQFRTLTDAINIKDAFVVNIGINFDILVRPNYSSNEVIILCIDSLKTYFNINKWQINQPIIMSEIYTLLDQIKGVQTVQKVEIVNKTGTGYSAFGYDIKAATRNNIIYPSLDPCIFELKYPNIDIRGRSLSI